MLKSSAGKANLGLHVEIFRWKDVQVIDVFGYPRSDYLLKMTQKMADMNTKK